MSSSAATYNRARLNLLWSMLSLPPSFRGKGLLESADVGNDLALTGDEAESADWDAFTDAVRDFQEAAGFEGQDAKLGPNTLSRLVEEHDFPAPDLAPIASQPARTRMQRVAESQLGVVEFGGPQHNPLVLRYSSDVGLDWVHDDETPWCSIFVNWCALKAGVERSGSAMARSWLRNGTEFATPEPGDVVVFWRGSPSADTGHVALFHSYAPNGQINVLGGNQSNRVVVSPYSEDRLLSFRRLSDA